MWGTIPKLSPTNLPQIVAFLSHSLQQPPQVLDVFGGAEEDRTPDLRIANATLSQLSYRPDTRTMEF